MAADDEEPPADLPAWLKSRVADPPSEKLDLLRSEKAERFTGTREKLHGRLESKSAAEIEAYIDGMMTVVEASKFNPETDVSPIPLNTNASGFNDWKVMQPHELQSEARAGSGRHVLAG